MSQVGVANLCKPRSEATGLLSSHQLSANLQINFIKFDAKCASLTANPFVKNALTFGGYLMRFYPLLPLALLAACADAPSDTAHLRATISTRDIAMNRPNTTIFEALFRLQADGSGRVWFQGHPDGSQIVAWTLTGNRFCINAGEGLLYTYGCATLTLTGDDVTLAHIGSDNVATGVLADR